MVSLGGSARSAARRRGLSGSVVVGAADARLTGHAGVAVVAELDRGPEKLAQVLRSLVAAEVNLQYIYSLMVRPHDKALLALHSEDPDFAQEVLLKAGVRVLSQKDISR